MATGRIKVPPDTQFGSLQFKREPALLKQPFLILSSNFPCRPPIPFFNLDRANNGKGIMSSELLQHDYYCLAAFTHTVVRLTREPK